MTGTSSDEADPFLGQLKLYTAKLLPLQRRLQEYNLSFLVLVRSSNADEPVWQQVSSQMASHLMSHELHLTLPPEELRSEHDFCFEGYQFLQAGYQKSGSRKMNVCDLPGRLITLERLRDCSKSIPNPSSSENFPVLWCSKFCAILMTRHADLQPRSNNRQYYWKPSITAIASCWQAHMPS